MVAFDSIQIIEFSPGIGDSPFVNGGVPLALGDAIGQRTVSVQSFERHRQHQRRSGKDLVLKEGTRLKIVRSQGYDDKEIDDAARKAYNCRKNIAESIGHQHWDKFNERVEATRRRLSKIVGLRRSSSTRKSSQRNLGIESSKSDDSAALEPCLSKRSTAVAA